MREGNREDTFTSMCICVSRGASLTYPDQLLIAKNAPSSVEGITDPGPGPIIRFQRRIRFYPGL